MFDGLEHFKNLMQSGDYLFQQISNFWNQGPKVDVYEQGNQVLVLIEAPGLMDGSNLQHWAVRVLDQNLYLRGQLELEESGRSDFGRFYSERQSEQFTKMIPLPAPVERKPSSFDYKDGLITIVFDKHQGPVDKEWHKLDFSKRSENK